MNCETLFSFYSHQSVGEHVKMLLLTADVEILKQDKVFSIFSLHGPSLFS